MIFNLMDSATLLSAHDRCPRYAHWLSRWTKPRLAVSEVLYRSVVAGLETEEADAGQRAGDEVMTLASDPGLDIPRTDLYLTATHYASLADLITSAVRVNTAWARPEGVSIGKVSWESSAFLEPSGLRLRQLCLVSAWSKEREMSETHAWRAIGEVAAYEMPMTLTVVALGQSREGRRHGPWTKGWLHPLNKQLRIRKRTGESFGGNWTPVWREQHDELSRDKWLDAMRDDGVMGECLFEVDVPVPPKEVIAKVRGLAEKKLARIQATSEAPEPSPSMCWFPTPCPFTNACWQFTEPSLRLGYRPVQD